MLKIAFSDFVAVGGTWIFLCRLRSIAAHRGHFVWRLCVCVCVCLSSSRTFLVVTHSYVSQVTHAFLGMLPLCLYLQLMLRGIFPVSLFLVRRDESPENYCHSPGVVVVVVVVRRQKL